MGDHIYNYGNGNIVNRSNHVQIVDPAEHQRLLKELEKLSEGYCAEYPEDEAGFAVIDEAIVVVRNQTGEPIELLLARLGKKALKVAVDLSLTLLVKLICGAIGLL